MKVFILFFGLLAMALAQRPSYAQGFPGNQLGYRFRERDSNNLESNDVQLGNRFNSDGTPVHLPVDALGDYDYVKQISKWPRDKQPYWYINSPQIEALRQTPPQAATYRFKPYYLW